MDITLHRDQELFSESRHLPAEIYNTAHTLLAQSEADCVFIPIRSMQFLAIIDAEEIVFVPGDFRNIVAIAWTDFRPNQRSALHDPVPYIVRHYRTDGVELMRQLQTDFSQALQTFYAKQVGTRQADILPFTPPTAKNGD